MTRLVTLLLILAASMTSMAQQTIYWKKDRIYANGKEVASVTPLPSDTTVPTTPTGLSITDTAATSVALSWTGSTDSGGSGLAGYKVYRQKGSGASLPVGTLTGTSFTDEPLEPSTSYTWTIRAFDAAQNHSAASNGVTDTTYLASTDGIDPDKPSGLRGWALSDTSIRIEWNASADLGGSGIAGYDVYREPDDVNPISGSPPITDTFFEDTGLTANTNYTYTILAYDSNSNESLLSDALVISTDRQLVFKDNFNRPDAAYIYGCSYMVGGTPVSCWNSIYPWEMRGWSAFIPRTASNVWALVLSTNSVQSDIRMSLDVLSNPTTAGIYFWDDWPYTANPTLYSYRAYLSGSSLKLSRNAYSGGETVLATASVAASIGRIEIEAITATRVIKVYYNGELKITYTETNTSMPNRGRAGLLAYINSGATSDVVLDNFVWKK